MCTIECPHCLGSTEVFNGETTVKCALCNGSGKVSKELNDLYLDMAQHTDFNDSLKDED